MTSSGGPDDLDELLADQVTYYRALAQEYDDHALPFSGGDELSAAIDVFQPIGDVLGSRAEPATGSWRVSRPRSFAGG